MFLQYLCCKSLVGASKYQQFKRMKVLKFEELQLKLMAGNMYYRQTLSLFFNDAYNSRINIIT